MLTQGGSGDGLPLNRSPVRCARVGALAHHAGVSPDAPPPQPSPAVSLCTAAIPEGAGDAGPLRSKQDCPHAAAGSRDEGSQGTESAASIPAYLGLGDKAGSVPIGETGSGPQGCPQSPSPPTACPRLSCHPAGCACSGSRLFISRERPPATPLPGPWGSQPSEPPARGLWSRQPSVTPSSARAAARAAAGGQRGPSGAGSGADPRPPARARLPPVSPGAPCLQPRTLSAHARTHTYTCSLTYTHAHSHARSHIHTCAHTFPTCTLQEARQPVPGGSGKWKHSLQASPGPLSRDTAWHMHGRK